MVTKKKTTFLIVSAGIICLWYGLNRTNVNYSSQTQDLKNSENVQYVKRRDSAIENVKHKDSIQNSKTSLLKSEENLNQEITEDQKERTALTQKIIQLQEFGEMNKSFEDTLLPALNAQGIDSPTIEDFVINYNFNSKLESELNKLHKEDLHSLLEVLDHPLTKKLKSQEKSSQTKLAELLKDGQDLNIAPRKKELIDSIITETNSLEQTESVVTSLFAVTYSTALQADNKKTMAEIRNEASQLANKMAANQMPYIQKVFEITYDSLNESELDEYLRFMQKSDARRATEVSLRATQNVLGDFLQKFTKMLADEKNAKTTSI